MQIISSTKQTTDKFPKNFHHHIAMHVITKELRTDPGTLFGSEIFGISERDGALIKLSKAWVIEKKMGKLILIQNTK